MRWTRGHAAVPPLWVDSSAGTTGCDKIPPARAVHSSSAVNSTLCRTADLTATRPVSVVMEYAKEVHAELFEHRRGIWDCGDGISCLFDNDPDAHCMVEIDTLLTLLTKAGCTEVELATYPAPGDGDGNYTLAMLVRGDAQTILSIYEMVDRELDAVRELQTRGTEQQRSSSSMLIGVKAWTRLGANA